MAFILELSRAFIAPDDSFHLTKERSIIVMSYEIIHPIILAELSSYRVSNIEYFEYRECLKINNSLINIPHIRVNPMVSVSLCAKPYNKKSIKNWYNWYKIGIIWDFFINKFV